MIRLVVQRKDDRREGWRDVFVLEDHEHRIGRRSVRYRIRPRRVDTRPPRLPPGIVLGEGPAPTRPPPRVPLTAEEVRGSGGWCDPDAVP